MKAIKSYFSLMLLSVFLAGPAAEAQAQNSPQQSTSQQNPPKKKWSRKAKGAAIGTGAGAATGAIIGGGKGAVIGGAVGAVGGGLIGRKKDKNKDPERHEQYTKK